jgi:hypothetical protein
LKDWREWLVPPVLFPTLLIVAIADAIFRTRGNLEIESSATAT